jgi:C4-dicarboxylate-specific signal transduction histidine kinase
MTAGLPSGSWNMARNSMQRLELSASRISRGRFLGIFALGLSAFLLVMLGIVLNLNLNRLGDSLAWVQHSNDILLRLSQMEQNLGQVESSARAYVLTSDRAYLAGLDKAHRNVERDIAALHGLVFDNPVQTRNLDAARPLIAARLARLEWFARLDPASGRALAVSGEKGAAELRRNQQRIASRIDGALAVFRAREIGLLASRQVLAQRDTKRLNYLAILAASIAAISGALGIFLLIREKQDARSRGLQIELMHMQRLGVMGQSSATLAHEINQPLTAASNYVGVIDHLLAAPGELDREKLRDINQRIARQIERVGAVVKRLRDFVNKRDGELVIERPQTLVDDAAALFATFDDSADFTTSVAPGLPDILVDRIQMQQVLVNLMRNALQAMPPGAGRAVHLAALLDNSGSVQFSVRDSGPGLSQDIAGRLFEPFVSTKQDGMGVGLSICRKILDDHGGRIWAESAAGGAVFCFAVPPAAPGEADVAA